MKLSNRKCTLALLIGIFGLVACNNLATQQTATKPAIKEEMVVYPEKKEMILHADRPPQLETPLHIFKEDFTPNEYFFVRWHLSTIVTKIDIDTFRLRIGGDVEHAIELSVNDLKTQFPPDSINALAICSGNSRSSFQPRVPGLQWKNGAMGNAKWKGVKLKDILAKAGVKKNAVDVAFQGLDKGALPGLADFVRSLDVSHAMDGEVMVAYEMNGQPIPLLNGFPLKLVVPGWYASYWISSLSKITVLPEKYSGVWMDKSYLAPPNNAMNESPDSLVSLRVPLTKIKLHSIFVAPESGETIPVRQHYVVEGLAFTDGTGLNKVELSLDGGKTWMLTKLNQDLGKYSWRRWKFDWQPQATGKYDLMVRATDAQGNTQPEKQWNRNGYARGFIEHTIINVH